jgi:NAD(P)-dependent dehydrogenase (short-subunit alcohol dehydrogenase family)
MDKVVFITGGASGIGEAVAERVVAANGTVVIADLREEALAQSQRRLSQGVGSVHTVRCDVTEPASAREAVEFARNVAGGIDALVNSAGIASTKPFALIDDEEYDAVMGVNVRGVWNVCQAAVTVAPKGSLRSIVNISSVAGIRGGGVYGTSVYAMSKGAVIALTKALARELAPDTRCNAVAPGLTMSAMGKEIVGDGGDLERVLALTPLGRPAEPSEVAAVAAFLASQESAYVTGHVYAVDGGIAM